MPYGGYDRESSDSSSGSNWNVTKVVTVGFAVIGVFTLLWGFIAWFGGWKSGTPVDKYGLSYSGGPFEGKHYQGFKGPGSGAFFNGIFDKFYELPANQRSYIVSQHHDEGDVKGADAIVAPSSEGVPITFETATLFQLNPKPDVLREFYERICTHYDNCQGSGWNKMLAESLRQVQESTLQIEARRFSSDDLWKNPDALRQIQDIIGQALQSRLQELLTGRPVDPTNADRSYFTNIRFQIKSATPPPEVVKRYNDVKQSALMIQTRANEVKQAQEQARAAAALQQAIRGNPNYVLLKAIESGQIKFWVLPGNGANLTLPASP